MKVIRGKPLSPGYGVGRAVVLGAARLCLPQYRIEPAQVEAEHRRLQQALDRSREELERLQARVMAELGHEVADIFSAHLAFLRDKQFVERVKEHVAQNLVNVEQACRAVITDLAQTLASVDDEYLREREQDVRDMGRRVLRHLARHAGPGLAELPPESVIVARELLPSELMELTRDHVAALVTEQGGWTSHAAILARSLGVPAVTGAQQATAEIEPGARLLVDGEAGMVWIVPSEEDLARFTVCKERYEQAASLAAAEERQACVTRDGVPIRLYANIARPQEAVEVARHYLDGVGLFRTEYLFLGESEPPGFERQREAYRLAAELLAGRPLVLRTLDLGADKNPPYLAARFPVNPSLGLRGLRLCLAAEGLFRTQLRAILANFPRYDVRILFPMVLGAGDLQRALAVLRSVAAEVGLERLPPVGALVETPSAVFTIAEITRHVDFLSIGTNDLTQYVLAADRNALEMFEDCSILHPAVLRAVKTVVQAAAAARRPVCVCGEAAGDPAVARLLVGLGVRELSMSPALAPRVRQLLRASVCAELEHLAQRALDCDDPDGVRKLLHGGISGELPSPGTVPPTARPASPVQS
ncbi:phosphoenolpyruvate--protein phosphotransferase [Pelomicrobium sp.]|jgi:phosphoenolpyruvate-protein phosphotransferase|uniref:phosphoenolpyruvate--protein phosphotransferase n=1 Tax=Pelomicrobium sp. TaxID=2815319 RepID=UPI002FDED0B1